LYFCIIRSSILGIKLKKTNKIMHIFDKYLNDENADKRERAKLWRTSIGLQAVDNLTISASILKWHVNI
jgi:hypothetical protein